MDFECSNLVLPGTAVLVQVARKPTLSVTIRTCLSGLYTDCCCNISLTNSRAGWLPAIGDTMKFVYKETH